MAVNSASLSSYRFAARSGKYMSTDRSFGSLSRSLIRSASDISGAPSWLVEGSLLQPPHRLRERGRIVVRAQVPGSLDDLQPRTRDPLGEGVCGGQPEVLVP